MGALDLLGTIALQDAFSVPLDKLQQESREAERALESLGGAGDSAMAGLTARLNAASTKLAGMKQQAAGIKLGVTDKGMGDLGKQAGDAALLTSRLGGLGKAGQVASAGLDSMGLSLSRFTGAAGIGLLAAGALRAAWDLGELAQAYERGEKRLAAFAGSTSEAGRAIRAIQDATGGAVSEADALGAATRLMSMGLAKTADEAARMAKAALMLGDSSQSASERLADWSAMLANMSVERLDSFGISSAKVRAEIERLQASMPGLSREQAFLTTVMAEADTKMRALAASGVEAGTETDRLRAEWADLRLEMGRPIVGVVKIITSSGADLLADINRRIAEAPQREAQTASETVMRAAKAYQDAKAAYELTVSKNYAKGIQADRKQAMDFAAAALGSALAVQAQTDAVMQGIRPMPGFIQAYEYAAKATAELRAEQERLKAAPMTAFSQAMTEATTKMQDAVALGKQLGEMAGSLDKLRQPYPQMPDMPKSLAAFDAGAWRAYAAALPDVGSNLEGVKQKFLETVTAVEQEQQALAASTWATEGQSDAFRALSLAAGVSDGSIGGLIGKLETLPPALRAGINDAGLLAAALAELRAQASAPISIGVQLEGLEEGLTKIDNLAVSLASAMGPERARAFHDKASAEFTDHVTNMGKIDKLGRDMLLEQELTGYEKMAGASKQYYAKAEDAFDKHADNIAASASELQSKIEAALSGGSQVTPEDMLNTKLGKYQDVAMESARRLDAIAQRGFSELKAHPDWAAALKIPPDVLAGTEGQLKGWAQGTAADVRALTRPDLIDWEAFGRQWDAQQQKQAAKQLTIDTAVTFLDKSGRLQGKSKEEAAKEIARQLGMAEPELSINALFQKAPGSKVADLVTQYLEGKPAADIPAQFVMLGKYNPANYTTTDEGLPQQLPAPQTPAVDLSKALPMGGEARAQAELAGQTLYGGIKTGFEVATKESPVAAGLAAVWNADFAANAKLFEPGGTAAGHATATAYKTALVNDVGAMRKTLAALIAPEVAAILDRKDKGGERP